MAELLLEVLALLFLFSAADAARGAFADAGGTDYTGEALRDRVTDPLPGFNPDEDISFEHFAGHVTVNITAGRALFYWFIESVDDPASKPLVLWLNGGPGCSSVGYGAMQEIGPFHLDKSRVVLNPYSWNKVANILFLESPAGVGFSYSNTSSDLKTPGDSRTASDSFIFLQNWLDRFPKYKNREFYITGESYAGFYVPLLAKFIHEKNKDQESEPVINLKGFMVGNPVTDDFLDTLGSIDYWLSHALISHHTHRSLMQACIFEYHSGKTNDCDSLLDYAIDHEFGYIDPYDIYTEPCVLQSSTPRAKIRPRLAWRGAQRLGSYDPCIEDHVSLYLNKPEVQRVLHANATGTILHPWSGCSPTIGENWQHEVSTVLPIYRELIEAGLRIWVYSGDVDAVVPVTSTRYSIEKLNLTVVTPWFPWYRNYQVGGYSEVYEGLTFVTVRGAGHEVPMFQPARAFSLIEAFIAGREMPKEAHHSGVSAL